MSLEPSALQSAAAPLRIRSETGRRSSDQKVTDRTSPRLSHEELQSGCVRLSYLPEALKLNFGICMEDSGD
jgi:hypothetical protein